MVSAYGTKHDITKFDREGYLFIVRAEDGHYISGAHKFVHGKTDKANLYVDARSMYFDLYGMIYMSFSALKADKGMSDGSITDYAPKVAVAAFKTNADPTANAIHYYKHM